MICVKIQNRRTFNCRGLPLGITYRERQNALSSIRCKRHYQSTASKLTLWCWRNRSCSCFVGQMLSIWSGFAAFWGLFDNASRNNHYVCFTKVFNSELFQSGNTVDCDAIETVTSEFLRIENKNWAKSARLRKVLEVWANNIRFKTC